MEIKKTSKTKEKIKKFIKDYPEVKFTLFLFSVWAPSIVLVTLFLGRKYRDSFLDNILAGGHGLAFDIFVFGVLIVIYNRLLEKKRDINRWKEEIDDYRYWKEPEATYRIVGSIRRLNKFNVHEFSLHSCYLKKACLRSADLHGNTILSFAFLEGADLIDADLRGVDLRAAEMGGAILEIANLQNANLAGATLKKAHFSEAILKEANLCRADLTGAIGLKISQLCEVKTLYGALLDSEIAAQVKEHCPQLLKDPGGGI
ncbi:MAG: pentapeptide repeat-containing protein [Candidatus Aminicenantes bacterium]|nr:pentapeptide repeat-containing protein [Candidatus Aminicenantes bacterium]